MAQNRLRSLRQVGTSGLIVLALTLSSLGLREPLSGNQEEAPIKLGTILVQVPVTVSEPGGRFVTDLSRDDFAIFEDGVKQRIEFFGSVEEPFSVALLLDCSGSTAAQIELIKTAALTFVDAMRARDRAIVISFDDSVRVQCELTSDRDILRQAVSALQPGEFTQVYEAVYTAVWERLHQIDGRKAVIVFTDGIDTASSEITREDTLDAIIESEDILVYPIRYSTRPEMEAKMEARIKASASSRGDEAVEDELARSRSELDHAYREADVYLHQLAEMSGAVVERADTLLDLNHAFTRLAEELRRQYLLGYYPTNRQKDERERKLRVEVSRPGLKVRARPAYRAAR